MTPLLLYRIQESEGDPSVQAYGEVLPSSNFFCPPLLTFPTPPKGIPPPPGQMSLSFGPDWKGNGNIWGEGQDPWRKKTRGGRVESGVGGE